MFKNEVECEKTSQRKNTFISPKGSLGGKITCTLNNDCIWIGLNACCSKYGNCGLGPEFCGPTCRADKDCRIFPNAVPHAICCSKFFNCGTGDEYCGSYFHYFDPSHKDCDPDNKIHKNCWHGKCCSKYGNCG